jgi:serine/threonine-protein kinase
MRVRSALSCPIRDGLLRFLRPEIRTILLRQTGELCVLAAARRLGPYEIVAPLGAGGMGEVYRARDTRLGREVAVKVLPQACANNPDRLARFEREARAVAALSHPNILAIHDYGTDEDVAYAVMELLEGKTLRGRLAQGPLPWREAMEVGAAIADGLAAAHAKGIVHRDLKPENLFLTTDARVKILDFGLARMAAPPSGQSQTAHYDPVETQAGAVMGTVGYMSPEQVRGQPADATSDLFSFGCVLYEMVTGQRAFQRETAAETMTAILHDEPPSMTHSGEPLPPEIGRIIQQCLAKTPSLRMQSAHELAVALRATASVPALQYSPTPFRFTLRPIYVVVTALLIAGVGAAAYHLLAMKGSRPEASQPAKQASAIRSVAILPFLNVSNDSKTEHLSEGIPDTVIHRLSGLRLPNFKVQSLLAVARYKARQPDLDDVRRELGVGAVVTGRVQQRGDRLVISVALTDVRDGTEIWGDEYDEKLDAVLTLQDKIAKDVARHLRLQLTGDEERRLAKRDTDNPEAYQLYLKGRYFWNKRAREGLEKAIEYFGKAIDADPTYALAYAGLADAYAVFPDNTDTRPSDSFPKAKAAATKALEIDKQLAEAHATLALLATVGEWNWSDGESRFQRAIELDPNCATARKWYGQYLTAMGRFDEARVQYQRALELDPLSLIINVTVGYGEFYARRYDAAIAQYRKTLEMDADFWVAHIFLGQAFIEKQMYDEALAEFEAVRQFAPGHLHPLSLTGRAYGLMGRRAEAQKVIDEFLALERYVPPCRVAVVYASLGDNSQALDWLERAYEGRCSLLRDVKVEPAYKDLHAEPRYISLLQRMRLVDKVTQQKPAVH